MNGKIDDKIPEKMSLSRLEQVLRQNYSDYSIGCYCISTKDNVQTILKKGINLKKNDNEILKSDIKHMGVVRNASFSKIARYMPQNHYSSGLRATSINVIVLIPQVVTNYYSQKKENYFIGHYPYDGEYPGMIKDVRVVDIFDDIVGYIPPAFIFGYIENDMSVVNKDDVKSTFIQNDKYYDLLSLHDKAAASYIIIGHTVLKKLIEVGSNVENSSVSMYTRQYNEYINSKIVKPEDEKIKDMYKSLENMSNSKKSIIKR